MSEIIRTPTKSERSPAVTPSEATQAESRSNLTGLSAERGAVAGRRQRLRLVVLLVLTALGLVIAHRVGFARRLTPQTIHDYMAEAGTLGVVIFLSLFAVRDFIRVPAFVFVGAAVLAYGPYQGGLLGFLGVNLAVNVCFVVTRAVGGRALTYWDRPLARRLLARLDRRPVLAVFLLRTLFMSVSPLRGLWRSLISAFAIIASALFSASFCRLLRSSFCGR